MDKKGDFPLLIRILGTLGELEGRGIIGTTLIISAAVMFSAILIYQGYPGWAILIFFIFLSALFFPRRKRKFQTVKRRYGITMDAPYCLEHLTRLFLAFNENSDAILGIADHTFIKIDGSLFPLIRGFVSYARIQMEGASSDVRSAIFVLAQGSDFTDLAMKYKDIFDLGGQQKGISVYWVKDLQQLTAILKPIRESKPVWKKSLRGHTFKIRL